MSPRELLDIILSDLEQFFDEKNWKNDEFFFSKKNLKKIEKKCFSNFFNFQKFAIFLWKSSKKAREKVVPTFVSNF